MEFINIDIKNGTVFIEQDGRLFKVTNVKQVFDALDQDGDGLITFEEFKIIVKDKGLLDWKVNRAFKDLDQDKDGKINFQEWLTFSHKLLTTIS